jgi:hypothetical protein
LLAPELSAGTVDISPFLGARLVLHTQRSEDPPEFLDPPRRRTMIGKSLHRVEGNEIHEAFEIIQQNPQLIGLFGIIIDIPDKKILQGDPVSGLFLIAPQRRHQYRQGEPPVQRHETAPELIGGCMKRNRQPHPEVKVGECVDPFGQTGR